MTTLRSLLLIFLVSAIPLVSSAAVFVNDVNFQNQPSAPATSPAPTNPAPAKTTTQQAPSTPTAKPALQPGASNPNAPLTPGASNPTPAQNSSGGTLVNPLNNINSLQELMLAILDGVVLIGSIFLTLMIVYVGFLFVAAQGNEEKIRSARSALVWTVIGGLILLGAKAIALVIEQTVSTL